MGVLRRALVTFGNGDCGRLGLGWLGRAETLPTLVRSLLDVRVAAVAAGGAHTVVAAEDGSVFSFGLNDRGQLGHDAKVSKVPVPEEVLVPERVVAVAAGNFHSLALADSGNVWAWGGNDQGQLGIGDELEKATEPRLVKALQGEKVVAIAAGADHCLALTAGGEVYSWGSGGNGRLGHGRGRGVGVFRRQHPEFRPRLIRQLEALRIKQIAAGQMHSACITQEDQALMWGSNRFWQLGLAEAVDYDLPHEVPGLSSIASLACGGLHSIASRHAGGVLCWGANQNGVLGQGHAKVQQSRRPQPIPGLTAEQVSAGWKHCAALDSGRLWTWGWGGSQGTAFSVQETTGTGGQLGLGDENDYWSPTRVDVLALGAGREQAQLEEAGDLAWRVLHVSCGLNHTAAVVELSPAVEL